MNRKQALIVQGGYEGHKPREISEIVAKVLREEHFDVEISDSLDVFLDTNKLKQTDLIVPLWTAGVITKEQLHTIY
ncbi:ThuA domain-containing protein [Paenibacillus solisilvae]|uniref:ThuA domain-containing protein n=1 Tax=Paenibacillus solisilvae TaxID=2486751 RepID=A0ABW0W5F6_9BACL